MYEHEINRNKSSFIVGCHFKDDPKALELCDTLIEYINAYSDEAKPGSVKDGTIVDKNIKNSIDIITDQYDYDLYEDLILQPSVNKFFENYPSSQNDVPIYNLDNSANIQYYPPDDGGFHSWHCERGAANLITQTRVLVFMTYLNDVPIGGETEFKYQNTKIKPEKGLTLVWPAEFTHIHRGLKSPYEKYIVTGWLNYKQ